MWYYSTIDWNANMEANSMNIKVLVIEDNLKLNRKICNALQIEGFTVIGAEDIIEAKTIFLDEKPDIILLDVMLPSGNGYDLIRFFKGKLGNCWVLMMTALNDTDCKKTSYEFGADDYITKPFDLFELIYKLRAIAKRINENSKEYTIGDIRVNEVTFEITKGTKKLRIPPSHIKFIKELFNKYKEGSYLTKFEFQAEYLKEFEDSNRIQTFVSRVRKNLQQIESENVSIETIYGKGYTLDIIEFEEDKLCTKIR
jgi:DNA-binding response OmpR family regulator